MPENQGLIRVLIFYFELLPEIEFDEEEIRQLTEENVADKEN